MDDSVEVRGLLAAMNASSHWRRVGLALLVVVVVATGCDEDDEHVCCPEIPAGRIEGFVRMGGPVSNAAIAATRVPDDDQFRTVLQADVDPEGWFQLDVPAGRYTVQARIGSNRAVYDYRADALGYGQLPPDTLTVDCQSSPVSLEFTLASLKVDVSLSDRLEGECGEVRLYRRGGDPPGWRPNYAYFGNNEIINGSCEIVVLGVLPGAYKIDVILGRRVYMCDCPYDGEHIWLPGTRDSIDAEWVSVPPNLPLALRLDLDQPPSRIEGEIVGAWRELGIQTAPDLALLTPDSATVMGLRRVNNDGTCGVDLHLPGPVKLCVSHGGGVERWIGGRSFADAEVFTLTPGDTVRDVRCVQSGLRLEIDVPPGGDDPYAVLRLSDASSLDTVFEWRGMISGSSDAAITNLMPGTYVMHIAPAYVGRTPWVAQWYDRAAHAGSASIITIPSEGDVVPLSVVLERGGTISGGVVSASGSTPRMYVFVTPAGEKRTWGYAYAWDRRSSFEVIGIPDGEWKIGLWPIEYGENRPTDPPDGTIWYPGTTDWTAADVIAIEDHADIEGIDIPID